MAKNRMEEKESLINKILSRQETSTRDYIVDDYLFPNQYWMGGDSKCFSGGSFSYWPVPNGCFFDESVEMGSGNYTEFWEIYPQSLINWDTAIQEYGFGEHNPIIAVIDSGFDIEHQDLVNKLWTCPADGNGGECEPGTHGYSYFHDSPNPPFYHPTYPAFHGTAVAGILAAENSEQGTVGVCPNCQLMILHAHSAGTGYIQGVEEAIYYAVANGAKVISISDSWSVYEGGDDGVLEAIQYAAENNVLFVSSAGNSPVRISEPNQYGNYLHPALWPEVFTAGGFQYSDGRYLYYHPGLESVTSGNTYGVEVNVSAPAMSSLIAPTTLLPGTVDDLIGGNISYWNQHSNIRNLFNEEGYRLIECPGGFGDDDPPDYCHDYNIIEGNITENLYSNFGGTSAATPMVSGLAGLLLSHNPNLTRENLIDIITTTSDDMTEYQVIPFDTEIPWQYPTGLPHHPYSTSVSPEEIPPKINVFNALYKLYNDPILGDINNDGVVNVQDVLMLMDLVLNATGRLPAYSGGICIGVNNEQCNSIPEEICQPEYAGTELSQNPYQWPSEWGCYWFVSENDYTLYDINGDGFIDVMDVVALMSNVLENTQTTYSEQHELSTKLNQLGGSTITLPSSPAGEKPQKLNWEQYRGSGYIDLSDQYHLEVQPSDPPREEGEWYVKLKEEPLVKTFNKVKSDNDKLQKIKKRESELLSVLDSTETKIKNIIPENKIISKTHKGSTAFFLNGNISDFEIKQIENIENVESVTFSLPAQITTDESVPLIRANDVWNAYDSSSFQMTGKNIRVGVLDSGVDSTHFDLGGQGAITELVNWRDKFIPQTERFSIPIPSYPTFTEHVQIEYIPPLLSNRKLLIPLESIREYKTALDTAWLTNFSGYTTNLVFGVYDFDTDSIISTHEIPDLITLTYPTTGPMEYYINQNNFTFMGDWIVWLDIGSAEMYNQEGIDWSWSNDQYLNYRAENISTGLSIELISSLSANSTPPTHWASRAYNGCSTYAKCAMDGFQIFNGSAVKVSQDETNPDISYIVIEYGHIPFKSANDYCDDYGSVTMAREFEVGVWTVHNTDGVLDFNVRYSSVEGEGDFPITHLNGSTMLVSGPSHSQYNCLANQFRGHSPWVYGPFDECGIDDNCDDWTGTATENICIDDYGGAAQGRQLILIDLSTGEEEYIDIGERGDVLSWDTVNNRILYTKNWRHWESLFPCEYQVFRKSRQEATGYQIYDLNTNEIIWDHPTFYPGNGEVGEPASDINYGNETNDIFTRGTWIRDRALSSHKLSGNFVFLTNGDYSYDYHGGAFSWVYDLSTGNLAQMNLNQAGSNFTFAFDDNIFCMMDKQVTDVNYHYFCHEIGPNGIDDYYAPYLNLYEYSDYLQEDLPVFLETDDNEEISLLNDKVVGGYNFVLNTDDFMDTQGHGTHVASTIAGNGDLKGVAPDAKIYAYKVCHSSGCPQSAIIAGIEASMDPDNTGNFENPLDVINMSLGGAGDHLTTIYKDYIEAAIEVGVTVVASAGNSGPGGNTICRANPENGDSHSICCPSCVEGVISVAASTSDGELHWWDEDNDSDLPGVDGVAGFSSRGPTWLVQGQSLDKPDITAPGVNICAAKANTSNYENYKCIDNKHASISGTSMSSPHIAGVAALAKQMNPSLTPQEIKEAIMSTSVDIGFSYDEQGAGRVDVNNLYQYIIGEDPTLIGCMDEAACNYNPDALTQPPIDYIVECTSEDVCLNILDNQDGSYNLNYETNVDIAGFQIDAIDCITNAEEGPDWPEEWENLQYSEFGENNFVILGYDFSFNPIPAGSSGTLAILYGELTPSCILQTSTFGTPAGGEYTWLIEDFTNPYCNYPNFVCPDGYENEGQTKCNLSECGDLTCDYVRAYFLSTISLFNNHGITIAGECAGAWSENSIFASDCGDGLCMITVDDCINYFGDQFEFCYELDSNNSGWISAAPNTFIQNYTQPNQFQNSNDLNKLFCSFPASLAGCLSECFNGEYDDCGVCNGTGYYSCWDDSLTCDLAECPFLPTFECWNGEMVIDPSECSLDPTLPEPEELIFCGDFSCGGMGLSLSPSEIGWEWGGEHDPSGWGNVGEGISPYIYVYPGFQYRLIIVNGYEDVLSNPDWPDTFNPAYIFYKTTITPGCEYEFQGRISNSIGTNMSRSLSLANQLIPRRAVHDVDNEDEFAGQHFDSNDDQHVYTEEFNNGILYFMKGYTGQWDDYPADWSPLSITFTPTGYEIYIMATFHRPFDNWDLHLTELSLQKVDPSCGYVYWGCTDSEATNYNPDAVVDDGSCEYDIFGCVDSSACNYPSDCVEGEGPSNGGCPNIDDGSCFYETECWDGSSECDSNDCPPEPVYGCTDSSACNYDSDADTDNGSCIYPSDYSCNDFGLPCGNPTDCNGGGCFDFTLYFLDADGDGLGCPDQIAVTCEQPNGYVENYGETTPENCNCFYNNFDCADVCSDPSNEPNQVNDCGDCVEVGGNQWPNPGLPCNDGCSDYLEECWDGSGVCDLADCPDVPPDEIECADGSLVENYEDCLSYLTIDVPCCGIPTLMSLPLLRDFRLVEEDGEQDFTLENTFGTEGPITSIIGEGAASTLLNGVWIGGEGLEIIDQRNGYWIKQSSSATESVTITLYGERIYPNWLYTYYMNAGTQPTLISYPIPNEQPAAETLEGMESRITGIINGDGEALTWMDNIGWVGSILTFKPGMGYWIQPKSGAPRDFTWNQIMTPTSSTSTQITTFNFTLPSNWTDFSINEIFDDLREQVNNQGLRKKPILINRKPKRRGEN